VVSSFVWDVGFLGRDEVAEGDDVALDLVFRVWSSWVLTLRPGL
jgi:hypothetical protein